MNFYTISVDIDIKTTNNNKITVETIDVIEGCAQKTSVVSKCSYKATSFRRQNFLSNLIRKWQFQTAI